MAPVAILDDYQNVAHKMAVWSALPAGTEVVAFSDHLADPAAVAARLADFEIVVAMRERTPFAKSLLGRMPRLRLGTGGAACPGGGRGARTHDSGRSGGRSLLPRRGPGQEG